MGRPRIDNKLETVSIRVPKDLARQLAEMGPDRHRLLLSRAVDDEQNGFARLKIGPVAQLLLSYVISNPGSETEHLARKFNLQWAIARRTLLALHKKNLVSFHEDEPDLWWPTHRAVKIIRGL